MTNILINTALVKKLIELQFPEFNDLLIAEVVNQGHDNKTFRLGRDKLIRLPSGSAYSNQVLKEQNVLPLISPNVSIMVPSPIKMGFPSEIYPWHFSIYKWIEGEDAEALNPDNTQMGTLALDLAKFLKELQLIDIKDIPSPGPHNFFRGGLPFSL